MAREDVLNTMNKKAKAATLELLDEIEKYESFITNNNLDLKKEIAKIKDSIDSGVDAEELKSQIFALVRVAAKENIGLRHYDVQMVTSNVVTHGQFAEMKTGEGKTLAITPAAVYKALTGEGVHIFTSNDYLAKTNYEELKPLYESLGLTVGLITANMTKEEKKKAYDSDIVYGSQEIIFDMLRDNTTLNSDNLVFKKAGFAIVDEADDLFIDSAKTPYIVSGSMESLDSSISDTDILKDLNKRYDKANNFVMEEIYKKSLNDGRVVKCFSSYDDFNAMNHDKNYNYGPNVYAVAIEETNQIFLTEAGWLKAYQFYCQAAINKLANEHIEQIVNSRNFKQAVDYVIIDEERIKLTSSGLAKAVETFPKFKEHNDNFYKEQDSFGNQHYMENALKAYFMINKGIDYELVDDDGLKRVSLVINGRTSKSRSYSEGLQQALELKEISLQKLKSKNKRQKIKRTQENNEIASTSTIAFFQTMYDDYAGLTGTAPKESFYNLYGKDTVEIEKNVVFEHQQYTPRDDQPTSVYKNETAKINAIIMDVRQHHAKDQPILIGTTSVEESEYIARKLKAEGFECQVLNAKVTDLEKEAKIVEQAGKPGAITVATNMAGRGTDIKLGGTLDGVKKELLEATKRKQFAIWAKQNVPKENFNEMFNKQYLENPKFIANLEKEATTCLEKRKEKAINSGGLYVLGASHNKVKRVDDQLRGRSARQSDPGESKFYTTIDELRSLGVHPDYLKKIEIELKDNKYLESELAQDAIRKAQDNNEFNLSQAIYNSQEFDMAVASFQESIYSQRRRALEAKEDLTVSIYYIIDKTVEDTIGYNIPETKNVTGSTKTKKAKLDYEKLSKDIKNNFGINMKPEYISENFETLKDLATHLSSKVKHNYMKNCIGKSPSEIQKQNQKFILSTIDQTWLEFRQNAKMAKEQQILDSFVGNKDHDRVRDLKEEYNKNIRQARMEVMQQTFGLKKRKIHTLESREATKEKVDTAEIDNSYNINKVKNMSVFNKAIEVMMHPVKTKKEKNKHHKKMEAIHKRYDIENQYQSETPRRAKAM